MKAFGFFLTGAACLLAASSASAQSTHQPAAKSGDWIAVTMTDIDQATEDPLNVWSSDILKTFRSENLGKPVPLAEAEIAVPASPAWPPRTRVIVSRVDGGICNGDCPTLVVLRRPGKADHVLLDDMIMLGGGGDGLHIRLSADLTRIDSGPGTPAVKLNPLPRD